MRYTFLIPIILISCVSTPDKEGTSVNGNIKKSYWPDLTIRTEVEYRDSVKHGHAKSYYKTGKLRQDILYQNGKKEGTSYFYYEDGRVYRETPYQNDEIDGILRKFHNNGNLMSEARYSQGKICTGLKEFNTNGSERNQFPTVKISEIDEIAQKQTVTLRLTVSKDAYKVNFYRGVPDENGCLDMNLAGRIFSPEKRKLDVVFSLPPGTFIMRDVDFLVEITTKQGNPYLVHIKHPLAVENRF